MEVMTSTLNIMKTQTANPLRYTCAPNYAGPDYIAYRDFRGFVAYGLMRCWLGTDANDPNSECYFSRPITREDVQELREMFLDCLESIICHIWKGDLKPGQGDLQSFDFATMIVAKDENDNNETFFQWYPRLNDDAIMMELSGEAMTIWLSYEALEDRENVIKVLQEARATVSGEVWDKLILEGRDWKEDVEDLRSCWKESGSTLTYPEYLRTLVLGAV